MKLNPMLKKAFSNMAPGKIVKEGFLGDDTRLLSDIISEDEKTISSINLDIKILLIKMIYLLNEGTKGLGEPVTIDSKWLVKVDESRGKLPCPYEDKILNKKTVSVKNLSTNEEILYSEMSIHLIEKHNFFQGKGSIFRLEPALLKRVLEI